MKRLKLAADYLLKKESVSTGPPMIGIESTNKCNLKCTMCPRTHIMTRKKGSMDFKLFKKIINEIKDYTEFIWLQDLGEPLLHPRIIDMIKYSKKNNVKCGISTNATMLNVGMSNKLLNSGLDYILFAFDGATKETYENIRVGADYNKVRMNILNFLNMKVRNGKKMFCAVQCIAMDETVNEIKDFRKLWNVKGVDSIRIRQLTYTGKGDYINKRTAPCYWLWYNPHIKWDGDMSPCCQDVNSEFVLGNVKNKSIKGMWNSAKMKLLRQVHVQGKGNQISICRDCNMYQPHPLFVLLGSPFSAYTRNKLIPLVESLISKMRYKR